MSTKELTQLIALGQLSLDHWIAEVDAKNAKHAYHDAIHKYESRHGRWTFSPGDAVCEATKTEYAAYLDAKRITKNIKRRLNTACFNTPKL